MRNREIGMQTFTHLYVKCCCPEGMLVKLALWSLSVDVLEMFFRGLDIVAAYTSASHILTMYNFATPLTFHLIHILKLSIAYLSRLTG